MTKDYLKENKLVKYINKLINNIYLGKIMNHNCKDCMNTYEQLIDGFKKIGFTFDPNPDNEIEFENINLEGK